MLELADQAETRAAAPRGRAFVPVTAGLSAAGRAVPLALVTALAGLVFLSGYDGLAYGLGIVAGCVLAANLCAPRLAGLGAATLPEAIAARFGHVAAFLAAVVIVLVVFPLLVAEFAVIGTLAEAELPIPFAAAILAVGVPGLLLALVSARGRIAAVLSALACALLAASLFVPLALLAAKHGAPLPALGYGPSLPVIAGLEETLVEAGRVDFETFAAHTAPFLRLTPANFAALIVSLALGMAVLPHVLASLARAETKGATRLAGAWMSLAVMAIVISAPALAAYAKIEIYSRMTAGTKLAELPDWLEAPSRADLARIHNTSLGLLEQLSKTIAAGDVDLATLDDALDRHEAGMGERWRNLDPAVQDAVVAAARTLAAGPATKDAAWQLYRTTIAPAAAAASGNEPAELTQAALAIEPLGVLLALPRLAGLPEEGAAALVIALLIVGLVSVSALAANLVSLATPQRSEAAPRQSPRGAVLIAGTVIAAAGMALMRPPEIIAVVVTSFSLAASGLFPAVALGLAWKRATAIGIAAAIIAGSATALYYDIGTQVFPAAFYRTWAGLSDASEAGVEEFALREQAVRDAADDEARAAALSGLDDWARGTASRPGLANWFGIESAHGAVFGVPAGIVVLVVVSLLTPRRRRPQP